MGFPIRDQGEYICHAKVVSQGGDPTMECVRLHKKNSLDGKSTSEELRRVADMLNDTNVCIEIPKEGTYVAFVSADRSSIQHHPDGDLDPKSFLDKEHDAGSEFNILSIIVLVVVVLLLAALVGYGAYHRTQAVPE